MKIINPDQYRQLGVPDELQSAVELLNEMLGIDATLVKQLLDRSVPIGGTTLATLDAHPSVVVRGEADGSASLTALGIIGGLVNSDSFRLMVNEEDDGRWSHFGVVQVFRKAELSEG